MKKHGLLWLVLSSVIYIVAGCSTEGDERENPADTVLTNASFYTVDENNSQAQTVAIKDGVIVYVGSAEGVGAFIGEQTETVDLAGKFAMPAFVDGHLHPLTNPYAVLFQVALFDLKTSDEYLTAIKEFAADKPVDEWIVGGGYDEAAFGEAGATKEVLDKILPNRAIALVDRDIHSILVNSRALELMGITKDTPDPVGGSIERDENGEATGHLIDDSAMNFARKFFPAPTKEDYKTSLLWMQKWLNREGITTAHDAWVEFNEVYHQAFNELANEGKLTVRYRGSWFIDPLRDYMADIDYGIHLSEQYTHPHFQVKSFKFLTDNVLEFDTALLLDESGNLMGVNNWEESDMPAAYAKVDKAGYQLHVHAVGDGGIRLSLDAIEAALQKNGQRDSRHSLAHVEVIAPVDTIRMSKLGVSAHKTMVWLEGEVDFFEGTSSKLGPVQSLIDAGVNVTISSDYATSEPDVMTNIFAAIQRDNSEGSNLKDMLKAATINGAHANFLENEVGSLEVGKNADIVVLSKNIFDIKTEEIPSVEIEMTFFEGRRVY